MIENFKTFDNIKHIDESGNEYWIARELQKILKYKKWENFELVIKKAMVACINSNKNVNNHFPGIRKMVLTGDSKRMIVDYKLTRYACYLIVQNGDSRKDVIAEGQTYFAVQTRKQELSEIEYSNLSEDERRIYKRDKTKRANYHLQQTAALVGVRNFDRFHNAGYKGLYNGETANDIAKRKGLRYREDILDNMCSEELAANEFRITQTDSKLIRENIMGQTNACNVHYEIGKKVRDAIKSIKGVMPEDLPTPYTSLKKLEKDIKK